MKILFLDEGAITAASLVPDDLVEEVLDSATQCLHNAHHNIKYFEYRRLLIARDTGDAWSIWTQAKSGNYVWMRTYAYALAKRTGRDRTFLAPVRWVPTNIPHGVNELSEVPIPAEHLVLWRTLMNDGYDHWEAVVEVHKRML